MAKADFSDMYAVTFNGGNYTLSSLATTTVTVKDTKDFNGDDRTVLGDVPFDTFKLSHANALNGGDYHFVSKATIDGVEGFVVEKGNNGSFYFITDDPDAGSHVGQQLTLKSGELALCFMPGTRILTPTGYAAVETLMPGDQVQTIDGRVVAVCWVGRQTVSALFADPLRLPIRVKAGALGDHVPCNDLLLSPDHALLVDGVLAQAGALVNGTSVVREVDVPDVLTYYHVEVDDHSLILAENAPAETFIDNVDRMSFDNWREFEELFPEGKAIVEMAYPRAKAYRQIPSAIRQRLADRGRELYAVAQVASAA